MHALFFVWKLISPQITNHLQDGGAAISTVTLEDVGTDAWWHHYERINQPIKPRLSHFELHIVEVRKDTPTEAT